MKKTVYGIALAAIFGFSANPVALAHEGVTNAAVPAWMEGMSRMGDGLEVHGTMAKGATPFDARAARAASAAIARKAAATPGLFETEQTDPGSEALPAIWDRFDHFAALPRDPEAMAGEHSVSIASPEDLRPALTAFARKCFACHEEYRE